MLKSISLVAVGLVLPAFLATEVSAQTRKAVSVVVIVVDGQGRAVPGAPVNLSPLTTAGGVTYSPAIAVRPNYTTERGVAVFNVATGQYQAEVGTTARYAGAIRTLRVRNRNVSVRITVRSTGLIVEPPGVFTPVPVAPRPGRPVPVSPPRPVPVRPVPATPAPTPAVPAPARPVDPTLGVLKVQILDEQSALTSFPPQEVGVSGVTVRVYAADSSRPRQVSSATSDRNGLVSFALESGAYNVVIVREGKFTNTQRVDVPRGNTRFLQFSGRTGRLIARK